MTTTKKKKKFNRKNFKAQYSESITTPPGRASFVNLVEPRDPGFKDSTPEYSMHLILDANKDGEKIEKFKTDALNFAKEVWGDDITVDDIDFWMFKDGDHDCGREIEDEETGESEFRSYNGYAGNEFFVAKQKVKKDGTKPQIVNTSKEIIDASKIYGGCRCRIRGQFVASQPVGKLAVSFSLQFVQFLNDMPAFSGRPDVREAFDEWEEDVDDIADMETVPVEEKEVTKVSLRDDI